MNKKTKAPEDMKDQRVTVRMTAMQYEILESYAARAQMNLAEYMREAAMKGDIQVHYDVVVSMPEFKQIAADLHGACNNLNQIARFYNDDGLRSRQMRESINACIEAIFEIRDKIASLEGAHHGHH